MSETAIQPRCCAKVNGTGQWGAFHRHGCEKKPTVFQNGKHYCGTHDPVKVAARQQKADARYEALVAEERNKWDRTSAINALVKDATTEEIEKLGSRWIRIYLDSQNSKVTT